MTTQTLRASAAREDDVQERSPDWWKKLVFLAALALAICYPFIDSAFGLDLVSKWLSILVLVILAMGLNVVVGYAGLLDLGYAAFFAIGAYTTAILTSPSSKLVQQGHIPHVLQHFWVAMAFSWLVAAVFGVILGAPTLRLRGDYLAIVTLGFGEIVPNVFNNVESVTGGPKGISQIAIPDTIHFRGIRIAFGQQHQHNWYWLMLAVGLLTVFVITRLYDSRLGRSWVAIREDEIAAASMGINLVRTKLWAFGLGASFSGFAGSIYAGAFQAVSSDKFDFSISVMVLSMVILGGLGNIYGVIVGGFLIASFDRILTDVLKGPLNSVGRTIHWNFLAHHDLQSDRLLVFGLALVLMMLLRPEGLFPSARRRAEMHPETDDIQEQEREQLFDVRIGNEAGAGERA